MSYSFEARYHRDRLRLINPAGDVGLLTLWSPVDAVLRRLEEISPELLTPAGSRIAAIGNLYGDGMYAMFCNLLFNPQVRHLVAIGEDLGLPTCAEIGAFLSDGLEDARILGLPVRRIAGFDRVFAVAPEFDERPLRERLSFRYLGKPSGASLPAALARYLRELPPVEDGESGPRVRVEMAAARMPEQRPSRVDGHQVVRRRPLDCWEELVVRTVRFGRRAKLRSGSRLELLNAKAVITEPVEEPAELLSAYGFSLGDFRDYQRRMFQAELPPDTQYTYGNRLNGYFRLDDKSTRTLAAVAGLLAANPTTRHAFVSIWDTPTDLRVRARDAAGGPCLVTLSFRGHDDSTLTLTASYRSHNLLIAWLENVYGLMAIQRRVAEDAGMSPGPITVISHSLGIDPRNTGFARAMQIAERWKNDDDLDHETGKYSLREDPHGYFEVGIDDERRQIVVEHRHRGVVLKRYTGRHASRLASEISADMSVSLVSHALWLGGELARKEAALQRG